MTNWILNEQELIAAVRDDRLRCLKESQAANRFLRNELKQQEELEPKPEQQPSATEHVRYGEYSIEFRIEMAKKHVDENYPYAYLAEEYGVKRSTLACWVSTYKVHGVDGFKPKVKSAGAYA